MSACPRCTTPLVGRRIDDVIVHECPDCEGVFLDENAIGLVIQDQSQTRATAVAASLPRRVHQALPGDRKMYVKCPTCSTMMNRKLFAAGSGIVIDVCRSHGTFFDAGELPAIIDFVQKGGLERMQRNRTVERIPLHKQPDGFAKQMALARSSRSHTALDYADTGGAFVSLLFELFS